MRTISDRFRSFAAENVRFAVVLAGFALFVGGLSAWSVPVASVSAGVLLMAGGLYPYLKPRAY